MEDAELVSCELAEMADVVLAELVDGQRWEYEAAVVVVVGVDKEVVSGHMAEDRLVLADMDCSLVGVQVEEVD